MKKGRLIVIEGLDGAGKAVQTKLLLQGLKKSGRKATVFDFPRYEESVFGKLVGEALQGMHGDFRNLSPYLASLPYVLDRATVAEKMKKALQDGDVICNRYTTSSAAYQSAKLGNGERAKFLKFLERAEYTEMGIPKPDVVFYLRVPLETALKLTSQKEKRVYLKKKGEKDQHEKDEAYQKSVAETYLSFVKNDPSWIGIECMEKGVLLSPDSIHQKIMAKVSK